MRLQLEEDEICEGWGRSAFLSILCNCVCRCVCCVGVCLGVCLGVCVCTLARCGREGGTGPSAGSDKMSRDPQSHVDPQSHTDASPLLSPTCFCSIWCSCLDTRTQWCREAGMWKAKQSGTEVTGGDRRCKPNSLSLCGHPLVFALIKPLFSPHYFFFKWRQAGCTQSTE